MFSCFLGFQTENTDPFAHYCSVFSFPGQLLLQNGREEGMGERETGVWSRDPAAGIQGAEPSTHLPPFLLCFRLSRWCLRGKEPSPVADTLSRDGALSAASTGCEPADTQARLAARADRLFLPGSGDEEAGRTNTLKGFGPRWSYRTSAVGEARAFSESEREARTRDGCGALATGHGEACHPGS